jgi:hypothetical protein
MIPVSFLTKNEKQLYKFYKTWDGLYEWPFRTFHPTMAALQKRRVFLSRHRDVWICNNFAG